MVLPAGMANVSSDEKSDRSRRSKKRPACGARQPRICAPRALPYMLDVMDELRLVVIDEGSDWRERHAVAEEVRRVVTGLDLPEPRKVLLVIELGPWHAGAVPGRVEVVGVGVVDERPVIERARDRRTARLGEQIAVNAAHPGERRLGVGGIGPSGIAGGVQDRRARRV